MVDKRSISQVFVVALELRALAFTPLLPGRGARGDAHRPQGGPPPQFGLMQFNRMTKLGTVQKNGHFHLHEF